MKQNLKNIIGSVVFLTLAVVMLVATSYMLRPIDGGISRFVMSGFYAEDEDSLDIVALGSSSLYRFLNNPVLWEEQGITSYNLATSSQQTDVYQTLLKEAQKTQKPDLFIIETRSYITYFKTRKSQNIAFRRVSDNMKYSWDRIKLINEYEPEWSERLNLYFDLISYHGQWENLELKQVKYYDNEHKRPLKSWKNVYKVESFDPLLRPMEITPVAMEPQQEARLIELLEYCREEEIEVVFLATPWLCGEDVWGINKYMEGIITSYGYRFFDANLYVDEMGLDFATDFYDPKHVNMWGAEKFTSYFGKWLVENYEMDLTHSKSTKKEWNEVVKRNKEAIETGLREYELKQAGLWVEPEETDEDFEDDESLSEEELSEEELLEEE